MRFARLPFLALGVLLACATPAAAQMVRVPVGGGGPTIGGPIGGGLGGVGGPVATPVNGGLTMPDLRGTLPNIETPRINDSLRSSAASQNDSSRHSRSTVISQPVRESAVHSSLPIQATHGVNLDPHDPPESKQKDNDDDEPESGSRWWIWLIIAAVVYFVATRKQ